MTELTEAGTSRTGRAGDITLHYNEAGKGDALIMLHGGGPGASGWSNFRGNIGPLSESFRVLLVDIPGFGKSDKPLYEGPQGAYSARAVRDLMDTLGIQKAHFIGNSLGGHISLRFALDYPDRAGRLILMAPATANMITSVTPTPTEGIKLLQGYYRPPGPSLDKLRAFIQMLVYDSSWLTDQIIKERYESSIEPSVVKWTREMLPRPGRLEPLWKDFDKIEHRTLLVWGRDDRVVPMEGGLFMMQRMKYATLHVMPRCGHWAMIEYPAEFNNLCANFLTLK